MIWALRISFWAQALADSSMSAAVRLLHDEDLRRGARLRQRRLAASYSQLVPGNTGMSTRGWAGLRLGRITGQSLS